MRRGSIDIKDSDISGDVISGNKIINGVDEEKIKEIIGHELSLQRNIPIITDDELLSISKDLLNSSTPPSLLSLFPDADECIVNALTFLQAENRYVTEATKEQNPCKVKYNGLLDTEDKAHLIISPGGAGKTHALWNLGNELLKSGRLFPIYISLVDFTTANEVVEFIEKKISTNNIKSITKNPSVVFLLDGWSQFPNNVPSANDSERRKIFSIFSEQKIIASARYANQYDNRFKIWNLEGLSEETISSTLTIAYPDSSEVPPELEDLLQLPLVLILYLLLGGKSSSKGELINAFHSHLTASLENSENNTEVLSIAAARLMIFSNSRKYSDFYNEITYVEKKQNVNNIKLFIEQLGTLGNRQDKVQPIHDLYWEWLVGLGAINDWSEMSSYVIKFIAIRESIKIALESGKRLDIKEIKALIDIDITFAAVFIPYLRLTIVEENDTFQCFFIKINELLNNKQSVNQYRGVLGGIASKNSDLFRNALKVISDLSEAGYNLLGLETVFDTQVLWQHRDIVSTWLKDSKGKHYVLDSIQNSGENKWIDWLGNQLIKGSLTRIEAVQAALGCTSDLPRWIQNILPDLIETDRGSYCLRPAAKRGDNLPLAYWVEKNYSKYVKTSANSLWCDFNLVLKNCGDEELFDLITDKLLSMEPYLQELLLYVLIETGDERLGKLQSMLLEGDLKEKYHKLYEKVYTVVSDDKAREWTKSENNNLSGYGWSVLAKRHQNAILSELISNLPGSFSDLHYIPSLEAMKQLNSPPESIVSELWKRITGTIQPRVLECVLDILSKTMPTGIPSVIGVLQNNPRFLPTYHLARFVNYLKEWQAKTGMRFRTSSKLGEMDLSEFLLVENFKNNPGDYFLVKLIIEEGTPITLDYLVGYLEKNKANVLSVLQNTYDLKCYHEGIVLLLLSLPNNEGLRYIINLFRNAFYTFPEDIMIQIFEVIDKCNNRNELLDLFIRFISLNPSMQHKNLHTRLLSLIMLSTNTDLQKYRDIATILAIYPIELIQNMIQAYLNESNYNAIWVIRNLEINIKKLLINENGQWI